ncbi:MAG: TlpA family protein disulfide reductase [Chitinophagaceae bacterium]|nr:TlpA family protein disulfide reductase [Chitinophagaceae bacterium]
MPANSQSELFRAQQELVGSKLMDLSFTDWLENQPADTNFKGKYKVLEFWATWCKPCLEAVPHMNKLQSEFTDSNIVFLSVTHQTREETAKTLDKYNFETAVVSDRTRRVHEMLRISYKGTMGLPRTVILDGENNIRWYGSPKSLTEKLINKLLTE